MNHVPIKKIVLLVSVIGIAFAVGFVAERGLGALSANHGLESVRENSGKYQYVQPFLYAKVPEEGPFSEYSHLKDAITAFASKAERDKRADSVSIYVRNLNTSQWVGVNTDTKYAPSSMLKVVTLIATLREVQENRSLIQKKFNLIPNPHAGPDLQDTYLPREPLSPSGAYTLAQLVEHMIVESDNVANEALSSLVGEDKLAQVYDDLQIPRAGSKPFPGYTTQEYSRIFRTIYNASYLSADQSEKALELLSRTNFTQGIVAEVPEGTGVSHKFGVNVIDEDSIVKRELHDCGVVYYPENPYFLCVMTRGTDYGQLEGVIRDASALV